MAQDGRFGPAAAEDYLSSWRDCRPRGVDSSAAVDYCRRLEELAVVGFDDRHEVAVDAAEGTVGDGAGARE